MKRRRVTSILFPAVEVEKSGTRVKNPYAENAWGTNAMNGNDRYLVTTQRLKARLVKTAIKVDIRVGYKRPDEFGFGTRAQRCPAVML